MPVSEKLLSLGKEFGENLVDTEIDDDEKKKKKGKISQRLLEVGKRIEFLDEQTRPKEVKPKEKTKTSPELTEEYRGVTQPEYTEDYGIPEGFVDYDSLGATKEERLQKAQELLQKETPIKETPSDVNLDIISEQLKRKPKGTDFLSPKPTENIFESLQQTVTPESTLSKQEPIKLEDVITFEEQKKKQIQEEGRNRLLKSIQDYEKGVDVFGIPNAIQLASEREKKLKENPYLMTTEEANNYYAENQHIFRDLTNTSRRMLKDIPIVGQLANTLLYHVNPEGFRYAVADELRQKGDADKYADYAAEFAGSLAGLFSLGGGIHKGINTLKTIETLTKTNPKIANAVSSFIAGTTYGGLGQAEKLSGGTVTPEGAIANSIVSGIVWTAFSQVGTKDWLNVEKNITPTVIPKGQTLKGFVPKYSAILNGQPVQVGYVKDTGFLAKSISNWLIDTGLVTGVSTVSNKVATAIEQSAKNDTPIVQELQKQFTELDLTQTGIEFAINAIFAGSMPRQYGKMETPSMKESKVFERKLLPGEREADQTVRESMKPVSPTASSDINKPFITPTKITPPVKESTTPPVKTPIEAVEELKLTSEPPITELSSGLTLEEEANIINTIAGKLARGNTELTPEEIGLKDKYPHYLKSVVSKIKESPEFQEEMRLKRQKKKERTKADTDNYAELNRQFKSAQRKRTLFNTDILSEQVNTIVTPEVRAKADKLLQEATDYNNKLIERNKFTLENLSRKKYGTTDLNTLDEQQQKDLLNEYNEMKKQGITEFSQIKSIKPIIQTIREEDYAIPERSTEEILQRQQEETGVSGSERGGVEPIEQGQEITEAEEEGFIKRPSEEETRTVTEEEIEAKLADIQDRIADREKITPDEYRFWKENQYAPEGFYYDALGNVHKKKEKITPLNEAIKKARQLGIKAYNEGKKQIPIQDPELLKLIDGLKVGEGSAEIMKAWSDAWDAGNLKEKPGDDFIVDTEPTEAQIEAGNYKKGHIKRDGFDITIENVAGSIRSGTDKDGGKWEIQMKNDYGYIKGTKGKDKDHLDVFLAEKYQENAPVFIINQTTPEGKFDEHKVMLGFTDKQEALNNYVRNYEAGWDKYSDIVEMPMEAFKEWSKDEKSTKQPATLSTAFLYYWKQLPEARRAEVKDNYYTDRTTLDEKYEKRWKGKTSIPDEEYEARKNARNVIDQKYMDMVKSEVAKLGGKKADIGKPYKVDDLLTVTHPKTKETVDVIVREIKDNVIGVSLIDEYGAEGPRAKILRYDRNVLDENAKPYKPPTKEELEAGEKTAKELLNLLARARDILDEPLHSSTKSIIRRAIEENNLADLKEYVPKAEAEVRADKEAKEKEGKPSGVIDDDMKNIIKDIEKGLEGITFQLKGVEKFKAQKIGYRGGDTQGSGWTSLKNLKDTEVKERGNEWFDDSEFDLNKTQAIYVTHEPVDALYYEFPASFKNLQNVDIQNPSGEEAEIIDEIKENFPDEWEDYQKALKKPEDYVQKFDLEGAIPVMTDGEGGYLYIKPVMKGQKSFQLKPGEKIPSDVQTKANELISKFVDKEIYQFNNIVTAVEQAFGRETLQRIFPALKAGYTAYLTNAPDEITEKMDSFDYVKKYALKATEEDVKKVQDILNTPKGQKPEIIVGRPGGTPEGGFVQISRPFIQRVREEIRKGNVLTKTQLENIAKEFDITDPNVAKEQAELAIVAEARKIISETPDEKEAYDKIVEMYNNQPNLTHRTSESVEKQQYSTPAPIAYNAGLYVADGVGNGDVLEPTAGNGMLVIAFNTGQVYVNEIDEIRNANLRQSDYEAISNLDAEKNDNLFNKKFEGIITNPPFGSADEKKFNDYKLNKLEHILAANALKQMKKDGRAAIIIGGHNRYDNKGRLQNDRIFFNWLYHHHNVDAVLNISGDLYKKQGTQFPIRLILINGKKAIPQGAAPLYDEIKDAVIKDFDELYNKVKEIRNETLLQSKPDAKPGLGGTPDVQSAGGTKIRQPGRTETIPKEPTDRVDEEKPTKPGKTGGVDTGDTGAGESISGRPTGTGRPDIGEPKLPGGIQPEGSIGRDPESGRSGEDIQGGFDREPSPTIARTDLESGKPNVPYKPQSKGTSLNTVIPRNMAYETFKQLQELSEDLGGDLDQYVVDKLGYKNKEELYSHLGAEQIDATALAIASIEKGQGIIIGDMAGVGKGRIAASLIRYAVLNGFKPMFFTEKARLFTDLYRDMKDTGNKDLKPFIINDSPDANITDAEGNLIYSTIGGDKKRKHLSEISIGDADYLVGTYSQVQSEKSIAKRRFIESMAQDNIIIMDESHNASGEGNTSQYFKSIAHNAKGVTFLSATFAKRPNNMPIYAMKTAISEANLSETQLIEAIEKGGVALQEILSTDLVESQQMIRREKSYEGIEIKYQPLENKKAQHTVTVDKATEIVRDVIAFQRDYIKPIVEALDDDAKGEGEGVAIETGVNNAGVDNTPFANKVFNVVDQLLFSLKAEDTALEAIEQIKQGNKPVIAIKNTMESFLEYMDAQVGDIIESTDFSAVLERALKGVFRIRRRDAQGNSVPDEISLGALSEGGRKEYRRILDKINEASTGITISPIDHMIHVLNKAGYKVGEVTGRKIRLQYRDDGKAIVIARTERDINKTFREFNNWENPGEPRGPEGYTDMALMINSSGSTGGSAHSAPTFKDKRPRVMVTTQIELNINTEVQKRGRINRTGQVEKPKYITLSSAIPAEQRLLMMAKKKLKSLDANVSSDQKQAGETFQVNDFLNKYGDEIVIEYLKENREMNDMLLDPFKMNEMSQEDLDKFTRKEKAAHRVTGRVAILPTHLQEEFYKEIGQRYDDYITYLNSIGENDLEVKVMPLEALTTNSRMLVAGKGGTSPFGRDSIIETAEVNVLRKPYRMDKITEIMNEYLEGKGRGEKKKELINSFNIFWKGWTDEHLQKRKEVIAKDWGIDVGTLDLHLHGKLPMHRLTELNPHLLGKEPILAIDINRYGDLALRLRGQGEVVENQIIGHFNVGDVYKIPLVRDSVAPIYSNGIFLGWKINPKRRNPYAPSAMMLKFAVTDSRRIVEIIGSKRDWLNDIISNSYSLSQWQKNDIVKDWDESLPDNRREIKHIVTGNILQAFGGNDVKGGQLISYSTKDGGIKRGILVTDSKSITDDGARVPIKRARNFIVRLEPGNFIESSNGEVTLINHNDRTWYIEVNASKKRGGKYYLDDGIRQLVKNGRFDKWGNVMRAEFSKSELDNIIDILQNDFGISVRLSPDDIKSIGDENVSYQLKGAKAYKDDFGNSVPPEFVRIHEFKLKHPLLKNKKVEIVPPKIVYWTRAHIKSYGYTDAFVNTLPKINEGDFGYEPGKEKFAVQITGASNIEGSEADIIISSRATPSAYAEEIVHTIQSQLEKVSPEVARKISEWESDVRELAEAGGVEIPQNKETFAQAFVFTHLGYASENPDVAELYEIPKDIYDEFVGILNQGEISADVLKGGSLRQAIRLSPGKIDNSLQNFRQKRQKQLFQLKQPTDKRIIKGQDLYAQLKTELGSTADIYPDWRKAMIEEFGKGFDIVSRQIWNKVRGFTPNIIEYRGMPPQNPIETAMMIHYRGFVNTLPKKERVTVGYGGDLDQGWVRRTQDEVIQMTLDKFLIDASASKGLSYNKAEWKRDPEIKQAYEYFKDKLKQAVKDEAKDDYLLPEYRRKINGEKVGEVGSLQKKQEAEKPYYQLKPAPKELIEKVQAKGLGIDQNLIATYNIKGTPKEYVSISTPDKVITKIIEVDKLDEGLKTFPPQEPTRSKVLSPKQLLTNSSGLYPTPMAMKEAQKILGDKFLSEFQKFQEKRKGDPDYPIEDRDAETAFLLEDFARRTVVADKLGIDDINADLYEITQKYETGQYQLRKPNRKEIGVIFNRLVNELKEVDPDYSIEGFLADWNGSELNVDTNQIIFRDRRSGDDAWGYTKTDFIKWLQSDEATNISKDADYQKVLSKAREIIREELTGESSFQLKKPEKDRSERFSGKKFENELAREQGREPESNEGNLIDFGVGFGQVFTETADRIADFVKNAKLERELGIENDAKLKKLYREFLTAPQWFFDKNPQLQRVWDIIDRHYVRNINEEVAILKEDKWKNGKLWRDLTDLEQKEFLSAWEEYEFTQYELQRDGEDLELLDWADFAAEFNLSPKVTEMLFQAYKPVIETALDMVKDVDRYKIIHETEHNPYLQNYYEAKASNAPQLRLDNELERAKEEFFNDDPNAEALFDIELGKMRRANQPINEAKALELAWKNNINLREALAEVLIDKKYARIDGKAYFPSSRLDRKYFLSAIKKTTPEEKLLHGKFDDRHFTTNDSLDKLNRIKTELETIGYTVKVGKFAEAQQEILENAITQEDVLDLALSAGIDNDNPILERLVKTIQAKGFSRHFIPKRFIPGFDYSVKPFEEAIVRYMNAVPFYKNRTIGNKELDKLMSELKGKKTLKPGSSEDRYIQDLRTKVENRDVKLSQALRAVTSAYYLALSPAYLSQQIVQPLNTLLPYLPVVAKELGLRPIEAEKAFAEAIGTSIQYWAWKVYDKSQRMFGRQAIKTFGLDRDFLWHMRSLERQGVGKPLRSMELTGQEVDPRKHYVSSLIDIPNKTLRWISTLASLPGIAVEDFTRTIGMRAYYILGRKAGLRGDKLQDFISNSIAKSYGPASGRLAKPPGYYIAGEGRMKPMKEIAQSTIESWLTFKNFAFMNFGQWGKLWRVLKNDTMFRSLAYKIGAQIGLAGLKYMMWTSSILTLMSGLYALLNITEDPEEQYEELFLHFNKLVPGLGDALFKGVASLTFKVDLSALFAQTAPIEEPFTKSAEELIGGAPVSAAKDIVAGKLPRSLRGFQQVDKYEEEGVTLGSRKLIPPEQISEADKTKRRLGYTPLEISKAYQEENTRQFKSGQYTDKIRETVEEEIIPLIEQGKGKEAREIFKKFYDEMLADDILTEKQKKSITGTNSFISQVILQRLEDKEREIIKNWKNGSKIKSEDRQNRPNRNSTKRPGSR